MKAFLSAAALLAAAAPAAAQTPVRVPSFDSLELRGGGEVTVRYGRDQSVTIVGGDPSLASITVDDDHDLVIRPCRSSCRNQRLRVEVVTPELDAIAIDGGGQIRTEAGFAQRRMLALAVNGGGSLDARTMPADTVAGAINGGGRIRTSPLRTLAAAIHGGGAITYAGDPSTTVSIDGGGTVTRER
jgi:Putative auto-transporter adhesin, head GIN domain